MIISVIVVSTTYPNTMDRPTKNRIVEKGMGKLYGKMPT
jgi:hypothetical protein